MKYFTPDVLSPFPPDSEVQQVMKIFDRRVLLYWRQLDRLKPRLSKAAFYYFRYVNAHDATLLRLTVGDDVGNRFPTPGGGALVNRRRIDVRLELLHQNESPVYELAYRGLRKFVSDFPAIQAWYSDKRNAIDGAAGVQSGHLPKPETRQGITSVLAPAHRRLYALSTSVRRCRIV